MCSWLLPALQKAFCLGSWRPSPAWRGKGTKAQRLLGPQLGCYSSQRPPRSALAVSLLPPGQARKQAEESQWSTEGLSCKA